jgi:hypothetical protein
MLLILWFRCCHQQGMGYLGIRTVDEYSVSVIVGSVVVFPYLLHLPISSCTDIQISE